MALNLFLNARAAAGSVIGALGSAAHAEKMMRNDSSPFMVRK